MHTNEFSQSFHIQRTLHRPWAFIDDMSIHHGGAHVLMPQQFLNGSYIISIFQQLRCEAVSQSVHSNLFMNICFFGSPFDSPLQSRLMDMMPTDKFGSWIDGKCSGREHPLPSPFRSRIRIFSLQGFRQIYGLEIIATIFIVKFPYVCKMIVKIIMNAFR